MDEARWLREADQMLRAVRRRSEDVRAQSANHVVETWGYFRRGLVLLHAATKIGVPQRTNDLRMRAVLGYTVLQAELLWAAWQAMRDGHYATAVVPCRLIAELTDFIPAASMSDVIAEGLLTNAKLSNVEARKAVLADVKANSSVAEQWVEYRKRLINTYNATAHVRTPLMMATTHMRGAHLDLGHDFNLTSLQSTSRILAQLSVNANLGVGLALSERLPDGGAWSAEQRQLRAGWEAFLRSDHGAPAIVLGDEEQDNSEG